MYGGKHIMADAFYIRVMSDPWAKDPTRKYSRHNMHSLVNKVFQVVSPIPQDEEIVSIIDGSTMVCKCYLITRDEFLKKAPEFEDTAIANPSAKTIAIPMSFVEPWIPDGRIVNGKSTGLEEGVRKSKRWVEEAEKLGKASNPFLLKSKWV